MSLRQAAQQALEALEYTGMDVGKFNRVNAACAALRAALAEPEQEVEQALEALNKMQSILMMKDGRHPRDVLRAFIQQAALTPRKPLTEPELHAINPTWPAPGQEWGYEEVLAFVRAIERAHGIGEQHE